MNIVFLLLGANLGNPKEQLKKAIEFIGTDIGNIQNLSRVYESEAWGVENQPIYYNQVIELHTKLDPESVLEKTQAIENRLGRMRTVKWAARLIDIDILYFNSDIIRTNSLIVPHPHMAERNFTLIPLVEINKNFIHPVLNKSNQELLNLCIDTLRVKISNG